MSQSGVSGKSGPQIGITEGRGPFDFEIWVSRLEIRTRKVGDGKIKLLRQTMNTERRQILFMELGRNSLQSVISLTSRDSRQRVYLRIEATSRLNRLEPEFDLLIGV